jgi:AraC-like DNA-binding protein
VDIELVDLMGWTLDPDPAKAFPGTARQALIDVCRRVTARSIATGGLGLDGPEELSMRDEILARLEATLQPWLRMPGTSPKSGLPCSRDFEIFEQVSTLFEQHDLRKVPAVDELAAEVGASRRRLFYSFRHLLGMGPYAYLELLRLHRLRHRLLAGKASGTCVTRAATDLGFGHLGRLSERYRQHFGELPKGTLKRGPG